MPINWKNCMNYSRKRRKRQKDRMTWIKYLKKKKISSMYIFVMVYLCRFTCSMPMQCEGREYRVIRFSEWLEWFEISNFALYHSTHGYRLKVVNNNQFSIWSTHKVNVMNKIAFIHAISPCIYLEWKREWEWDWWIN